MLRRRRAAAEPPPSRAGLGGGGGSLDGRVARVQVRVWQATLELGSTGAQAAPAARMATGAQAALRARLFKPKS